MKLGLFLFTISVLGAQTVPSKWALPSTWGTPGAGIPVALGIVQEIGGTGTTRCDSNNTLAGSQTCTFSATPSAGNGVLVSVGYYNNTGGITLAVMDNQAGGGNTYTPISG